MVASAAWMVIFQRFSLLLYGYVGALRAFTVARGDNAHEYKETKGVSLCLIGEELA
jgi:hypothetical protein